MILAFSLAAKSYDLSRPPESSHPCARTGKPNLIFDEAYYVNAARVIAGINPPKCESYHNAPLGKDPNAEHPQLAKAIMAGGIELFGDNPVGWRIGSVIFGAIALLALYAMVRAAGASAWLGAGVAAVCSLDNLMLVHSRIGTLDIYAVAMMLVAGALYMRERPLLAGLALGVAACMKEVALSLLFVLILLEALRIARVWMRSGDGLAAVAGRAVHGSGAAVVEGAGALATAGASRARATALAARRRGGRLALFAISGAVAFLGLLWLLDVLIPAYDPGTHRVYAGNPIAHFIHMYKYALLLTSKPGETGIASHPLAWLLNEKAINYFQVTVSTLVDGKVVGSHATISFQGLMNPFIIFLAIPATFAAVATGWRGDEVAALGACWVLGTYLPFLFGDLASNRVSYLYYMLIVMPGLYIVTVKLFSGRRMPRAAALGWAIALIYGFIHLYPFRTLL